MANGGKGASQPGSDAPSRSAAAGVIDVEDGREVVHYFVSDTDADEDVASRIVTEARALDGAWSDRDWEDAVETFDRIRHDSEPTPPIEAL
jgi:hypothetical protein